MSTIPLNLETDVVVLPPAAGAHMPLEQALKERRSGRAFLGDALPLETLSALLWAGFGINRPDSARRRRPTTGRKSVFLRSFRRAPTAMTRGAIGCCWSRSRTCAA
jgi:hypothetical protein